MLDELGHNDVDVAAVFSIHPRYSENIWDYRDLSELTMDHHIPHFRIRQIDTEANVGRLHWLKPDLVLVMGFQQLIPPAVLDIPPMGVIGSHASPLPANRGRHPVPTSILTGEETGGLTFFYLTPRFDEGDIVLQRTWPITVEDSAASLYRRMISTGREMLKDLVGQLKSGTVRRTPQDVGRATRVPAWDPSAAAIDWRANARTCYDLVRACTHPYPGAYSSLEGRKLTVWKEFLSYEGTDAEPGEVIGIYEQGVEIACGAGSVILQIVQIGDGPEEPARRAFDRLGVQSGYVLSASEPELEQAGTESGFRQTLKSNP